MFSVAARPAAVRLRPATLSQRRSGVEGSRAEPTAAQTAAGSYEKDGISFVTRNNWKVTEDESLSSGVCWQIWV